MLVVSADADPTHPGSSDAATAPFVGADHVSLARHGLTQHGHLMMIEHGNDRILQLILDWLSPPVR